MVMMVYDGIRPTGNEPDGRFYDSIFVFARTVAPVNRHDAVLSSRSGGNLLLLNNTVTIKQSNNQTLVEWRFLLTVTGGDS